MGEAAESSVICMLKNPQTPNESAVQDGPKPKTQ
jgi:hypothetical protein